MKLVDDYSRQYGYKNSFFKTIQKIKSNKKLKSRKTIEIVFGNLTALLFQKIIGMTHYIP